MKIFDAHIHTCFENETFIDASKKSGVDFTIKGLENEMKSNNIVNAVSIPITKSVLSSKNEGNSDSFTECKSTCVLNAALVNPLGDTKKQLIEITRFVKEGRIKALKIYLGYYHLFPFDRAYLPFYEMAGKNNIPVIFHTGDTFSENAKLKFAHPLNIDEVAVDYKDTKFIIAHFGNPWFNDAAAVVYKNVNVYADLSGLFVGNDEKGVNLNSLREAANYAGFNRLIYGSDWPLAKMNKYVRFVKSFIPRKFWNDVFYNNALKIFNFK